MGDYRFAIIGCGKIAPRHAKEIAKIGKLHAVCDIIPGKAETLGKAFDAKVYHSLDDLLKAESANLDVVSICTPNSLHAPQSIQALKNGLHVLCEKPLAISSTDANAMIAVANESGRKLFVVKSTRYNPTVLEVKKLLEENRLGKVYSFQLSCFWNRPPAYYDEGWRGTLLMDGGTLFTQFSHYIDVLFWLLGEMKSCFSIRKNLAHEKSIEFEDTGVVAVEMESGALGTINYSVNTFSKNMEVSLSLIAEKGTIRIGGEYLNKLDYQDMHEAHLSSISEGNPANEYGLYRGSMGNHREVYDNLVKALQNPDHPFTDGEAGLKTIEIIEKIYSLPLS